MELYNPIAKQQGFLIYDKYDFSKSEPYSALIGAMRSFCEMILLEDRQIFNTFKCKIQEAVGEEGGLLTDAITNLYEIIGLQPSVPSICGQDAKNRFVYVFIKFIKAICSVGRSITLILDDLQWIDIESHNLFSALIKDYSIKNLMIIGAYRDDEINNDHPLAITLRNTNAIKYANVTKIKLKNLNDEAINDLISDSLQISSLETYPLTALVNQKTKGNKFFVNQFLRSLFDQKAIFFDDVDQRWKWKECIFGENNFDDSILELLRKIMLSMDEIVQEVLKIASYLGSSFSHS